MVFCYLEILNRRHLRVRFVATSWYLGTENPPNTSLSPNKKKNEAFFVLSKRLPTGYWVI